VVVERRRAEPGFELEGGGMGIRGSADDPPRGLVQALVGPRLVRGGEDSRYLPLPIGRAERRSADARLHKEVGLLDLLRIAGRQGRQLTRRRLRLVTPDGVVLSAAERLVPAGR